MHPAPVASWNFMDSTESLNSLPWAICGASRTNGIWMEYEWILEFKSTGDLAAKLNLHLRWSASSAFPCHWMSCVVAFDLPKMQNVLQRKMNSLMCALQLLESWMGCHEPHLETSNQWASRLDERLPATSTVQSFQIIEAKRWVWQYSEATDQDSLGQWRTETAKWNFWVGSFANVVKSETLLQLHLWFYKDLQFMIHLPTSANMMNMGLSNWNHPPFWRKIHIFQLARTARQGTATDSSYVPGATGSDRADRERPRGMRRVPPGDESFSSCGPQPKYPPDQVEAP